MYRCAYPAILMDRDILYNPDVHVVMRVSRLMIVSREAKKKQAVHDE